MSSVVNRSRGNSWGPLKRFVWLPDLEKRCQTNAFCKGTRTVLNQCSCYTCIPKRLMLSHYWISDLTYTIKQFSLCMWCSKIIWLTLLLSVMLFHCLVLMFLSAITIFFFGGGEGGGQNFQPWLLFDLSTETYKDGQSFRRFNPLMVKSKFGWLNVSMWLHILITLEENPVVE